MNLYVIAIDKGCEFGPPIAARSTREGALIYVRAYLEGNPGRRLFIFPLILNEDSLPSERPMLVGETKIEEF